MRPGSTGVVRDHGIGIPKAALPHLFDRYYPAEAASRCARGLGIGLYVAKTIVEAHGGTIHVRSEPGKGSQFTVRLPAAEGAGQGEPDPERD